MDFDKDRNSVDSSSIWKELSTSITHLRISWRKGLTKIKLQETTHNLQSLALSKRARNWRFDHFREDWWMGVWLGRRLGPWRRGTTPPSRHQGPKTSKASSNESSTDFLGSFQRRQQDPARCMVDSSFWIWRDHRSSDFRWGISGGTNRSWMGSESDGI